MGPDVHNMLDTELRKVENTIVAPGYTAMTADRADMLGNIGFVQFIAYKKFSPIF